MSGSILPIFSLLQLILWVIWWQSNNVLCNQTSFWWYLKIHKFISFFNFFFLMVVSSMGFLACFNNFGSFSMSWPSLQECALHWKRNKIVKTHHNPIELKVVRGKNYLKREKQIYKFWDTIRKKSDYKIHLIATKWLSRLV